MMRLKILRLIPLAVAALTTTVVLNPAAAHAGPTPPYDCHAARFSVGGRQGGDAWCNGGFGYVRVAIWCQYPPDGSGWYFTGPWVARGQTSTAYCPAAWPVLGASSETRGVG